MQDTRISKRCDLNKEGLLRGQPAHTDWAHSLENLMFQVIGSESIKDVEKKSAFEVLEIFLRQYAESLKPENLEETILMLMRRRLDSFFERERRQAFLDDLRDALLFEERLIRLTPYQLREMLRAERVEVHENEVRGMPASEREQFFYETARSMYFRKMAWISYLNGDQAEPPVSDRPEAEVEIQWNGTPVVESEQDDDEIFVWEINVVSTDGIDKQSLLARAPDLAVDMIMDWVKTEMGEKLHPTHLDSTISFSLQLVRITKDEYRARQEESGMM